MIEFVKWLKIALISGPVLIFLVSCSNEYFDYHSNNSSYDKQISEVKNSQSNFSLSKIKSLDVQITNFPDKGATLDKIISGIKKSKKRVYLEVYILTEKRIINELINAKKKGLDVKVILEKNVFGSPRINNKTFQTLKNIGIETVYSSNKNYNFTHSKIFIMDDTYLIGTGNMSHSTFYKNKEFFVFGNDIKNLKILELIFKDDIKGIKSVYCNENIIVSPVCSRLVFENILSQAKESIYIYAQQISDPNIEKIIKTKINQGLKVNLILADPKIVKSNKKIIDDFIGNKNVSVSVPKKFYIHAKAFVIDNETIYIGSINFTSNSIDNNREVGIIFNNKSIGDNLIKQFSYDISQ